MHAYYNENDPFCAQWLKNLIDANFITKGDVDARSVLDVKPDDLKSYTRCHFFAGIAGWDLALQLADFPADREVWTGSCPCQPFSAAGKAGGFADERHLWPYWFHLIAQQRPDTIFGEQVASKAGVEWLALVHADMEAAGYAFAAADLGAACVGAPHIRQRLWFVVDARRGGLSASATAEETEDQTRSSTADYCGMGNSSASRLSLCKCDELPGPEQLEKGRATQQSSHSFWADCDWLSCIDEKTRPVEPGTFPLAYGIPGRVGRLRAYGNAIVPQVAAEFIKAALEFCS